ncbi:DNA polymerase III subunit gamma and tau [Haloechinothrix halophila]|uniref:DNA polymerase III subunit gamma and tau n=1 Tax=Haloechinothrix halophila TaxID=1069073 RepID=UPI0005585162|nr:DNA polymerase III subunit gamma and tau [Haloechinothrix halophila]
MALALYRKYRPATFAEVVGQDHVTEPLRAALAAGRINHAYLFSGPRGCGKTSSARIMARSLNCVDGPTPDPCGKCDSCIALAPEGPGSVDVVELDAASHGGVDDARELRDRAFYAPADSRYRVFIIDEAHMVTTQGFNALLKIVEEPPEHLIFLFATTEPDKVLQTIRSRTHHYPFRLIPPSSMRELLERNVEAEGVPVEPAVYPLVIRAGGGSARDTQSLLDQLLAGAGEEGVTYDRAVALLGVTDRALINDMVDALADEDAAAVFGTVERLADAGHDPRRFASDLLDRLRDLVLLRSVPDAGSRGLVNVPDDELSKMTAQADRVGAGTLTRYAEIVHNGLMEMRGATSPRLLLELLCARMMLPAAAPDAQSESAVLQRLERLERRATASGGAAGAGQAAAGAAPGGGVAGPAGAAGHAGADAPQSEQPQRVFRRPSQRQEQDGREPQDPAASASQSAPASAPQQPAQPADQDQQSAQPAETRQPAQPTRQPAQTQPASQAQPAPEPQADAPSTSGGVDATGLRGVWPQLLATIRNAPGGRSIEAMLTQAGVRSVDGNLVVLTHKAAPLARRLSDPTNVEKIAAALREVLGGDWQVRCEHEGAASQQGGPAAKQQQPRQQAQQQAQTQRPSRPSQQERQPERPQPRQEQPQEQSEPDIPLPPEPAEDEDMYTEEPSSLGPPQETRQSEDPSRAAHQLLSDHLGARRLD